MTNIHLLNQKVDEFCKKSGGLSKRKLSKVLNLSPSFLSQVLSGKRRPSDDVLVGLCQRIGFSDAETSQFLTEARIGKTANENTKVYLRKHFEVAPADDLQFAEIPQSRLGVLRHWVALAILECFDEKSKGFGYDDVFAVAMARRFNVAVMDVEIAIERLLELGYLKKTKGKIVKVSGHVTTPLIPSTSIRRYYQSILQKAQSALEEQSPQRRDYSVMTMRIDPGKLPKAQKKIEAFRRELMAFLESGSPSEVYALNINLFSLESNIPKDPLNTTTGNCQRT